jgi:hypothetical protein
MLSGAKGLKAVTSPERDLADAMAEGPAGAERFGASLRGEELRAV